MMHSNRLAAFFAALTGVLYGVTITLAAAAYGHGATTMTVLLLRCGLASVVLSVIYGIMSIRAACGASRISDGGANVSDKSDSEADSLGPCGTRAAGPVPAGDSWVTVAPLPAPPGAASCRRRKVATWLAGSAVAMATFSLCFFQALTMIPVADCMVIVSTYPLVTLALTAMTEPPDQRPGLTTVALHVLGFAGLVLALVGPSDAEDDQSGGDGSRATGYALVAVSSIGYALHAFCNVRLLRLDDSIIASAAAVNVGQTVIFAIVYAAAAVGGGGQHRWGLPSSDDAQGMSYLIPAVVLYTPAQLASFAAFALATNASHVTFFINFDSVTAILLAVVVLGEAFAWYHK